MNTTSAMPLPEFWSLVATLGWHKKADSKAIKAKIMSTLTREQVVAARETLDSLEASLYRALTKYERETGESCGCGDDSFSDLIAHIVGLGQAEYEATLANPKLAIERAHRNDYTESFTYCWPWGDDYDKRGNAKAFAEWAEKNRANYTVVVEAGIYAPVHEDAKVVLAAMDRILAGDVQGFLSTQEGVEAAMKKVVAFKRGIEEALSGFDSNVWAVKNLYTDVKEAFAV